LSSSRQSRVLLRDYISMIYFAIHRTSPKKLKMKTTLFAVAVGFCCLITANRCPSG
jgi:hypothetical protein